MHRENMEKAVSRYSLLFTLPSSTKIMAYLCFQCLATGVIEQFSLSASTKSLVWGLALGGLFFVITLVANQVTCRIILKKDSVFDLRRCSFFSLISNLIVTAFVCIAALFSSWFGDASTWFKVMATGFFVTMSLSFLVFSVLSLKDFKRIFLASTLQPLLFLVSLLINHSGFETLGYPVFYVILAILAALISVQAFISDQNTVGIKNIGFPSVKLFKAFLVNWTEGLQKPFEDILEQLSEEREITVSFITFKTGDRLKTVMVVPTLHAGPFKNIGSSAIPSLIQMALEKKLRCIVSVPHGISGHELDLASQTQNQKFIEHLIKDVKFDSYSAEATPFVSTNIEGATAGCQIFGNCALITLTLAPETMEDLPLELNETILSEAQQKGLSWAVTIDAHNSIQGTFDIEKTIEPLKKASKAILEYALSFEQSRFEVGAAKVTPSDFGIKEGFGPSGITVTVIRMNSQVTAYVTIDGNNIISGLREKILTGLLELGINNGEVFTTDTHMVNAVVMNKRGYNPVGEVIDQKKLMDEINRATAEALGNLEPAKVSWQRIVVQRVKVIGERQIDKLSLIVDEGAKRAKKTSAIIFPTAGFVLAILLYLL